MGSQVTGDLVGTGDPKRTLRKTESNPSFLKGPIFAGRIEVKMFEIREKARDQRATKLFALKFVQLLRCHSSCLMTI